mmetsp:Transcript_42653/g.91492  ORF Transcript_42653/g.91492 Transcript_42653/m.91492 type:complete len:670 (+) Transcript_42653:58-2067(+)
MYPAEMDGVPVPVPVKHSSAEARRRFINDEWNPFLAELEQESEAAASRRAQGFLHHEVMPPHSVFASFTARCLSLTQRWHGRGNVSAVYEAFMRAAEWDGVSLYRFEDIRQGQSPDGYIRVLDASARRELYVKGSANKRRSEVVGRVPQATGESPIDNLVLPGLMRRDVARMLFVGHRIQQWFLRVLRRKQQKILGTFGLLEASPEIVRERLGAVALQDPKVPENSAAFRSLLERGTILQSYGQLPEDVREGLEQFLETEFRRSWPEHSFDPHPEVQDFLEHCHKHPGRSYGRSAVTHKHHLLRAFAAREVRLVWRSDLEKFTQHKYFVVKWSREHPLLARGNSPTGDPLVLRARGTPEVTRFRKNVFPYAESHGLGQSGGGCAELVDWPEQSLMYELGTLLCLDEASKVPNHNVTDIERIVRDCLVLCPDGPIEDHLPGETLHDVGQNPVVASSVGQTQHTQAMRCSAEDFPLLLERRAPRWVKRLASWLDIIQVGSNEDAFFVRVQTKTPASHEVLEFLIELRLMLMKELRDSVDFTVTCHPMQTGEFVLCMAPVACLKRIPPAPGSSVAFEHLNPITKDLFSEQRLPSACVDCSNGKGNVLAGSSEAWELAMEGREVLRRLYDFNRRPGTRKLVEAYFSRTLGNPLSEGEASPKKIQAETPLPAKL